MSSETLPPNPCLLAILLVAKVNSEPNIVFHYPPRPGADNTRFTRYLAAQDKDKDGSSSTNDDNSSSHDEDVTDNDKSKQVKTGDNTPELDVEEPDPFHRRRMTSGGTNMKTPDGTISLALGLLDSRDCSVRHLLRISKGLK